MSLIQYKRRPCSRINLIYTCVEDYSAKPLFSNFQTVKHLEKVFTFDVHSSVCHGNSSKQKQGAGKPIKMLFFFFLGFFPWDNVLFLSTSTASSPDKSWFKQSLFLGYNNIYFNVPNDVSIFLESPTSSTLWQVIT